MKPTVIFDFDGTIADSMWVIVSIYEKLLGATVTPEQLEHIRGLSAAQAIKELKVPLWKAPRLLTQGKKIMTAHMPEIQPCAGMPELIAELANQGYPLRIMSSNSVENVHVFLKHYQLERYFASIDGSIGLFVKAPALRKLIKQHAIPKNEVFYVGDEARDIDGAKKAHVPIISVGWGYNSPSLLQSQKPDYFVMKPTEILPIAEKAVTT